MSRPANKLQLTASAREERQKLDDFLSTLTPDQMTQDGILGPWSAKDVLAHLYEWEQMVLHWYIAGKRGETPAVPAEGYKWSQILALNQYIYEKHRDRQLEQVLALYRQSHAQVMETIEARSEKELFTPGLHPWMNKNYLASYFASCTSSHYRWARTEMRKGLKALA